MTVIPVQTPFLAMAGLGVEDAPADPADPHDLQGPGIHLRWSFPTRLLPGLPMPIGWPELGFTLYRREAVPTGDGTTFDLPGTQTLASDATLPLPNGGRLEFDPDLLRATLIRVPDAAFDINLLLDAYPGYVTLRFALPLRQATIYVVNRPHQGRGPRLAAVRGHDGQDSVVDEASHVGNAPNGEQLTVTGDRITHVRFRLDGLRMPAYTIFPLEPSTDTVAWEEIADLPPLTAWRSVRDRIPAELHAAYERGWTDLGAELTRLFDPADARPRWLRTFSDVGTPRSGAGGGDEVPPSWSYSLQPQILLFTIDPFIARLLGLLYVDASAEAAGGDEFDYLVVGTFEVPGADAAALAPPLLQPTRPVPDELRVPDFLPGPDIDPVPAPVPPPEGTVGWITYARSIRKHPPLARPQMTLVESSPARTFLPDPATGALTSLARVGLAWSLQPQGDGGPIDAGAVRYDVEVQPDGEGDWTLLTPSAKVVVAAGVDPLGIPTVPRHHFIDRRGAGTHLYRASGIDIFGRRSDPARPLGITIADEVGPPPPVNIWTRYLDPADPWLAADEQDLGQGLLVSFDYPRRPYEAGLDAARFDLYTFHGPRDLALDWHEPATWGAPVASVPHRERVEGTVTSVRAVASDDPLTRRVRVVTDIDAGAIRDATTGYVLASVAGGEDQEYQVAALEPGATTAFTLAWPLALGLPDPAPGPCTWFPGYQAFLPGYRVPLGGAGSVTGVAALGGVDVAGNLGRISSAAAFQRVDYAPPAPPGAFDLGVEELLASPPDAHGRSRFTLSWEPAADGSGHLVYRALDAAVLARHGLTIDDGRGMDAAALKALGDDLRAEEAFSQLTAVPVHATSYTDETLEGFASNRYLYRLRTVSAAGTRGVLGECSPPVAVPDVVPPRRPTVIRTLGGDGVITLTFTPSTEHDADHYAVYRASTGRDAQDTRSMTLVGRVPHDAGAATVTFADDGAAGPPPTPGVDHRYRVTAADRAGNESRPSRTVVARCFSTALPPVPRPSARRAGGGGRARVAWPEPSPGVRVLVQRRTSERGAAWQPVSSWLSGVRGFEDRGLDPAAAYGYRLKAMSPWRTVAVSDPIEVPPP